MRLYGRGKSQALLVAAIGIAVPIGVLLGKRFYGDTAGEKTPEAETVSGQSHEEATTVVRLDQATQRRSGIMVSQLESYSYKKEQPATATIVDSRGFMHEDLQSAASDQNAVFIRLNASTEAAQLTAATSITVRTNTGVRLPAFLVTDSQGENTHRLLRYRLDLPKDAMSEWLPGMMVTVYLPVGSPVEGVVVPDSAVVWWEGQAWIYRQQAAESPSPEADQFVRRRIPTDAPLASGWFISKAESTDEPVVTAGAQLLLSEEFKSQIPADE